jgi:hypothetical protein
MREKIYLQEWTKSDVEQFEAEHHRARGLDERRPAAGLTPRDEILIAEVMARAGMSREEASRT